MTEKFDIIIIGGGIIGSLLARELSQYEGAILLLEKESDIGMGTSSANSALVHAGHDPKPGSLKSKLNRRGNTLWKELCPLLQIPFKPIGSYVVAIGEEESAVLPALYERGKLNNIEGIEILGRNEMLGREPLLNLDVRGALWTPTAGIIDPFRATLHAAESAVRNGVTVRFNSEVTGLIVTDGTVSGIRLHGKEIFAETVINCAGLYSDEIAHMAGVRPELKILPRKGEYLVFDSAKFSMDHVLFPVPVKGTKGILVTTTIHGNVIVGPNAEDQSDKNDHSTSTEGMEYILEHARKLVPSLDRKHVIAQFSGLRATANTEDRDFIIEVPKEVHGFVNISGIESPGLASAPAIAEHTVNLMRENNMLSEKRRTFIPDIPPKPCFRKMSHEQRSELIQKDPAYGNIICRCEHISEGEIRDALSSPVPAETYDGIKRRTWLGTGRCQGSFDYPRVIRLIAETRKIARTAVTKKGKGSEFLFRQTKEDDDA